ncbi:MAG: OmpA family protein [Pseudomonadota bacterium]
MQIRRSSLPLIALSVAVASCGASVEPTAKAVSQCVDIPNGQYFQWVNGRLIGKSSIEDSRERPPETARRIGITLAGMGYPWVVLNWDGQTASIGGVAPNELTRSDAFIAAKAAFEADTVSGPLVQRVVNDMTVRDTGGAVVARLNQDLASQGFEWLRVVMVDNIALLVGEARNAELKQAGYRKGRSLIEADLDAGQLVNVVVDVISIPDNGRPAGIALQNLPAAPTLIDCENAFFDTLAGRKIEFMPDQAIIENSSSRVLDATSAIAQRCDAFEIEIGRHLGTAEDEDAAIDLSQRQASAIRDYLSAYGANRDTLIAKGYGTAQPLDRSGTEAANIRNTRTEFTVRFQGNN